MNAFLKKLTSRKLWTAIAGVVTGLSIIFGADEGTASTISGAVVSLLSVVSYIVTEGKIDAAAVAKAIEAGQQAKNEFEDVADE